jgi:hypothetical protein
MKSFFCVVLFALACAVCQAQNPAVGKWDCTSDDGHGGVHDWTLTIKETEGKLSGSLVEAETEMPLITPKLDGKTLSFRTFINPNCTVLFEVTIEGKKFDGKFFCPEVTGTLKGAKQL